MRQGSSSKRMRGRGNGRKNANPRSQSYESNGPDVKVRGNAQQVVEKYLALARDANSAGDRITAESYFQHAEHYYRLMSANSGQENREPHARPPRPAAETPQPEIDHDAMSAHLRDDRRPNGEAKTAGGGETDTGGGAQPDGGEPAQA